MAEMKNIVPGQEKSADGAVQVGTDMNTETQNQPHLSTSPIEWSGKPFNECGELGAKMVKIMETVKNLDKDGTNTFHKYKYTTEAAIKRALRKEFIEHRIWFNMEILDCTHLPMSNGDILTTIECRCFFRDIVSGETFAGQWYGTGTDKGDKGLYKAITGAIKYWLTTNAGLVPTGDDPEKDEPVAKQEKSAPREQSTPPQQPDPSPKATACPKCGAIEYVKKPGGITSQGHTYAPYFQCMACTHKAR